jgi:hypothetical protein
MRERKNEKAERTPLRTCMSSMNMDESSIMSRSMVHATKSPTRALGARRLARKAKLKKTNERKKETKKKNQGQRRKKWLKQAELKNFSISCSGNAWFGVAIVFRYAKRARKRKRRKEKKTSQSARFFSALHRPVVLQTPLSSQLATRRLEDVGVQGSGVGE